MRDDLERRLRATGLLGLASRVDEIHGEPWLERVITIETEERQRRGFDSRLESSRLGRFKPMTDYDRSWPRVVARPGLDAVFQLGFVKEGANVLLIGPSGVGKTMVAKNLAYAVIRCGRTALQTASAMLSELAAQEGLAALSREYQRFTSPALLVIDELGYAAYVNRHADVLFEVVNRRHELGRSIVVTTTRSFQEWGELFPNATCVAPSSTVSRSGSPAAPGDPPRPLAGLVGALVRCSPARPVTPGATRRPGW